MTFCYLESAVESFKSQRKYPGGLHSILGAALHPDLQQVTHNGGEVLHVAAQVGGGRGNGLCLMRICIIPAAALMCLDQLVVFH